MANINGNEIYFGIIGEVGETSGVPPASAAVYAVGTVISIIGAAEFEEVQ